MGDPSSAIRMNISLPGDLKKEMDSVPENVNWSAVAAEAFRGRLLLLQSTRSPKNKEGAVARLRAAKQLEENQDHGDGLLVGESWAQTLAQPRELKRLVTIPDLEQTASTSMWLEVLEQNGISISLALARVLTGRSEMTSLESLSYWSNMLDSDCYRLNDRAFADGFIAGASEFWVSVRDLI